MLCSCYHLNNQHLRPHKWCSFFLTLQQVVQQLRGALLKDSMTNELGNPSNDMDTQSNLLGLRVGFEEVGGVLGKSEEDGCSKELQTTKNNSFSKILQ